MAEHEAAVAAGPSGRRFAAALRDWLDAHGVTDDGEAFVGRPSSCVVLVPRVLQPHADRVDPAVHSFVGPILGDRAEQGSWRRPATADKVLLVSLGSAFTRRPEFYRRCVQAFGTLPGWHTVLQIGAHVDPAELGPVPGSVEVHRWVQQPAILEQADAFVTHAGMGGSSEGLYAGVPMIAVPQAADQFANAE